MTSRSLLTLVLAVLPGCVAGQSHVTHRLAQPMAEPQSMGRVALFSLVSGHNPKRKPDKDMAEVRQALQQSLQCMPSTQVTLCRPVPEEAIPRGAADRLAAALPYVRATAITAGADTVCLVHVKHGSGYLTLGLPQLARVWGECEYDLVILEAASGRELLVSSGTWSDGLAFPRVPRVPRPANVGQAIAQLLPAPEAAGKAPVQTAQTAAPADELRR